MVDIKKTEKLLNKNFIIAGPYTIDSQGVVHVQGGVKFEPPRRIYAQLPVKFGVVDGDFSANESRLTTFTNFPTKISGNLSIYFNPISSWKNAPEYVGKTLTATGCQFYNLQGMPEVKGDVVLNQNRLTSFKGMHEKLSAYWLVNRNPLQSLDEFVGCTGSLTLDYNPDMPLLRGVLAQKGISFLNSYNRTQPGKWWYPDTKKIEQIINSQAGKGRSGALLAAAELIRAGFPELAKW